MAFKTNTALLVTLLTAMLLACNDDNDTDTDAGSDTDTDADAGTDAGQEIDPAAPFALWELFTSEG